MASKKYGLTRRRFIQQSSHAAAAGVTLASGGSLSVLFGAPSLREGKEVSSTIGAVAAGPPEAARVGARILQRGGNAMDAAAAACLASCMLQPHMVDVGGYGCCAVVLEGKSRKVWSLDANAVAPAAAAERMFEVLPSAGGASINEREYACRVRDDANVFGPLSVAVPGVMAGIGVLWERWGVLKWPDIVGPSLELLEKGFPYGPVARDIASKETVIRKYEPTAQHLMPQGKIPKTDDRWHRPDMETTLRRLASAGWQDFYAGELGRIIADFIGGSGGILTRQDMAQYRARVTDPYAVSYRKATVYGAILANGCLTSLQILNMLGCFEAIPDSSVTYWHRLAEVLKLAWRDRMLYVADPDAVDVPVERLLSRDYAAGRVETLRQFPRKVDRVVLPASESLHGTVHLSAADVQGNVVSVTLTQGGSFGSCFTVPKTGIILGHGMCRLDPRPGRANSVGPRKRPLNNLSPLLIALPDRDVATGVPGGRRIVSVSAEMAQRIVDYGATPYESVSAPRIHVEVQEPVEITTSAGAPVLRDLAALGHQVKAVSAVAGAAGTAEVLRDQRQVRAAANTLAVGA